MILDIGATGNELTLPEVTRYATDVYICKVSNPHGTVTRRISITVKCKCIVFSLSFTCKA